MHSDPIACERIQHFFVVASDVSCASKRSNKCNYGSCDTRHCQTLSAHTRTNKYTIKKNQFSLSNSHLLMRSSRVEKDLLFSKRVKLFVVFAFFCRLSVFFSFAVVVVNLFFAVTTHFIHCMHLCLESERKSVF